MQKTVLATLGGAIVFFIAGFLIWGLALANFQAAHKTTTAGVVKTEADFILIIAAMLVSAFLFTLIFQRWAGIKTFATGAKAGAILAALIGLSSELMILAEYNIIDSTIVATNVIGNLVWGALGGGVIGWILGRGD